MPKVSVIMPVYNGERWVAGAIASILRQDFDDFELIVVNDGSTDGTAKILRSIKDRRVASVSYHRNEGYSRRLNEGIEISTAQFLARMDSDDISLPSRFSAQLKELHLDPTLKIIGTWTYHIDKEGALVGEHRCSTTHTDVAMKLLANITLIHHPTVMMRRTVFESMASYDTTFEPAEDFEMWTRAVLANQKLGIIPKHLLLYRLHPGQVSKVRSQIQWWAGRRAALQMLTQLGAGRLDSMEQYLAFAFLSGDPDLPISRNDYMEYLLPNGLLDIHEVIATRFQRSALLIFWDLVRRAALRLGHRTSPGLPIHIYHSMWNRCC